MANTVFYPREHFAAASTEYSLLPFRFDRRDANERFVDQAGNRFGDINRISFVVGRHGLSCFEREDANEN